MKDRSKKRFSAKVISKKGLDIYLFLPCSFEITEKGGAIGF
jgi:hypothetical protein